MEAIAELHRSIGDGIYTVLQPTYSVFIPLLLANKASILAIPRTTHSYGSHQRQKLDLYLPENHAPSNTYLIFLYGGGLVAGDKIVPGVPDGLIYHNVGAFFAKKGIKTIIADYRRVNSDTGGEDAVFPSGGDDLSLVLSFLESLEPEKKKDVFIMGKISSDTNV